jgi:quinol monooxygenase YgiN
MTVTYGFQATVRARPGMGDRLLELVMSGLDDGNPAASEHCLVYLVSRSASDPDVIHLTEGWTSEQDHQRLFAGPAAQALVARMAPVVAGESAYTDFVPVGGKAAW